MSKNIAARGIQLLKNFEGCELKAYKDIVGVWTIGYGHTATAKPGMVISQAEAERLLKIDLADFEQNVTNLVKVPLNQNQFDALVVFSYNVGKAALKTSTLLKKLNAGDYLGAADQFLVWNKAGGKVVSGLVRRRDAERTLFLSK